MYSICFHVNYLGYLGYHFVTLLDVFVLPWSYVFVHLKLKISLTVEMQEEPIPCLIVWEPWTSLSSSSPVDFTNIADSLCYLRVLRRSFASWVNLQVSFSCHILMELNLNFVYCFVSCNWGCMYVIRLRFWCQLFGLLELSIWTANESRQIL